MKAANGRAQEVELPKPFGAQKMISESQEPNTALQILIYAAGCWFCFDLIVTVPWFFPFGIRKSLTCFRLYGSPQLTDVGFVKRSWAVVLKM